MDMLVFMDGCWVHIYTHPSSRLIITTEIERFFKKWVYNCHFIISFSSFITMRQYYPSTLDAFFFFSSQRNSVTVILDHHTISLHTKLVQLTQLNWCISRNLAQLKQLVRAYSGSIPHIPIDGQSLIISREVLILTLSMFNALQVCISWYSLATALV